MNVLILEASTEKGLVALLQEGKVLYEKHLELGHTHSKYLVSAIEKGICALGLKVSDLDLIICGTGPGSYTGIRVCASVAKVLSFASRIPLVGISSLLAYKADQTPFTAIFDARISGAFCLNSDEEDPYVCLLDELDKRAHRILATPHNEKFRQKIAQKAHGDFHYHECAPQALRLYTCGLKRYLEGKSSTDGALDLLYLRDSPV